MNRNKEKDKDFKRLQRYTKASVKCKNCGHTVLVSRERCICSWCGYWVYKNDKIEFQYNFKKILKNN